MVSHRHLATFLRRDALLHHECRRRPILNNGLVLFAQGFPTGGYVRRALLFALVAICACHSDDVVVCAQNLVIKYSPLDTTVRQGSTVRAQFHAYTCGGASDVTSQYQPVWASKDTSIVSVDATGLFRALKPGTVEVDFSTKDLMQGPAILANVTHITVIP